MMDYAKNVQWSKRGDEGGGGEQLNVTEKIQKLKHPLYELSNKLSSFHWAGILKQYNISMSGHYVTVLPSIKISHVVPLDIALKVRNPNEKVPQSSKWNALTAALDPLDLYDADETQENVDDLIDAMEQPLYPKTPMAMFLTAILCAVSVFVITYTMIVMYRCICSRNYAEWRSSRWDDSEIMENKSEQQVLEGYPIRVKGHKHNIECVVSDGNLIATSCLQNIIKIWSSNNGELVAEINRSDYFQQLSQYNVEQGKSPVLSSEENLMRQKSLEQLPNQEVRLRTNLNFDFHSSRMRNGGVNVDAVKNEFQKSYERFFAIIPSRKKSYEVNI